MAKCPIKVADRKGIVFGEGRKIECINCPTKNCWEDLYVENEGHRAPLFLKDIRDTISELKSIEAWMIHEYKGAK